jgi:arylsulfatase A-like enzyme
MSHLFRAALFLCILLGPITQAADRPNILFAIADDWGFGHAGAYGCGWVKTPAFDRVAKDGILFTHAYTPNAKCAPSRACILTGRNSWQLKAAANHICFFPEEFRTYAEALPEQGYACGMTAKGWAPGVAKDANGKNRLMAGTPFNKRTTTPPTTQMNKDDYVGNFADFLDSAPQGKPWCFWYGSTEPHRGYEYGSGVKKGGKKLSDIDRVPAMWPDNEVVRNDLLDYAYEVEYFDHHLGLMLELLEKRGMLENTLVVVTSDNGMPFPRIKGQEYAASNHLPLAVMWKKGIASPGRMVDDYVSFIDFAPTFLEVADVPQEKSGMAAITGRSLTEVFKSEKSGRIIAERDHVLIGKERHDVGRPDDVGYPIRGIIKDETLYLENFQTDRWPAGDPETGYPNTDGGPTKTEVLNARRNGTNATWWQLCFGKRVAEEMYDLRADPDCLANLAGKPDAEPRRSALQQQMLYELKQQQDPRMFGRGEEFDQYPYADEKFKNLYNRIKAGEKIVPNWLTPTDMEQDPTKD